MFCVYVWDLYLRSIFFAHQEPIFTPLGMIAPLLRIHAEWQGLQLYQTYKLILEPIFIPLLV